MPNKEIRPLHEGNENKGNQNNIQKPLQNKPPPPPPPPPPRHPKRKN